MTKRIIVRIVTTTPERTIIRIVNTTSERTIIRIGTITPVGANSFAIGGQIS